MQVVNECFILNFQHVYDLTVLFKLIDYENGCSYDVSTSSPHSFDFICDLCSLFFNYIPIIFHAGVWKNGIKEGKGIEMAQGFLYEGDFRYDKVSVV